MRCCTSKVNCARGAPMGRPSHHSRDQHVPHKVRLHKVPMDSDGYDRGGAYWGFGQTLWHAVSEPLWLPAQERDAEVFELFFRADTRTEAREYVRERYSRARFYR